MAELTEEDARSVDLSPAAVARYTKPKRTWFVKRTGDGVVFACEEREAWDIIYNRSTWKRNDFKFIGCSDGKTYFEVAKASLTEARKLEPAIEAKKKEIARYRAQEDKFLMDEVVDMEGDPSDTFNETNKQKVLRMRKITERLDRELESLEKQYHEHTKDVVLRATAAERAVAEANWKKKKIWPRKMNVVTPDAKPDERRAILASMKFD